MKLKDAYNRVLNSLPDSRLFLFALIIGLLVLLCGIGSLGLTLLPKPPVINPGKTVVNERQVQNFDKVVLKDEGTLHITQGDTEKLTIEAGENLIKRIGVEVQNGVLSIGTKGKRDPRRPPQLRRKITYNLTVKNLSEISINNYGTVKSSYLKSDNLTLEIEGSGVIEMNLEVQKLNSKIRGFGEISLSGSAAEQSILLNGAGNYNANNLNSLVGTVEVRGAGKVTINSKDKLSLDIIGPGEISYAGNPVLVKESASGNGKIKKI